MKRSRIVRCSSFVHKIRVGDGRFLVVHAIRNLRLPVDSGVSSLLEYFAQPCHIPDCYDRIAGIVACPIDAIASSVENLIDWDVLTDKSPEEELAKMGERLSATYGRDPALLLEKHRRAMKEGVAPYWAAGAAHNIPELAQRGMHRIGALLFGDCDIQMESDFLRREAGRRGIDLRLAATFPHDTELAADHPHDIIFIGALRARHMLTETLPAELNGGSFYVTYALELLQQLRKKTAAPILIDNLPEPTVQPLGMAEDGTMGHRARFRRTNLALAEMAKGALPDIHIVDIAAAIAAAGANKMLDDWLVSFTHFGSPGWMLQRPETEKAAVHNVFPDMGLLAADLAGDPYLRESALARTHIDALVAVLGLGRKKCVIVDLDGTLWPGVLAETGAPFSWTPDVSGVFSYVGLYFGLHEALLCLKRRGILLACVSKNDEALVRELWTYPDTYPGTRLLTPDDFVTWRINWNDKVSNISSIAEELGFPLNTLLFIDDHEIERDRVRQRLPEVEVWGENPFHLRKDLLSDPRLQAPVVTQEAAQRSRLVKAQLARQQSRAQAVDESSYISSLQIQCRIEQINENTKLERLEELFTRTTQFNTTGWKPSRGELASLLINSSARVFSLAVKDRFGDHGITGAIVIVDGSIKGFVISCRVLGMGIEKTFLGDIVALMPGPICGRMIETSRNTPARNIYRDCGFAEIEPGLWCSVRETKHTRPRP